jgi:hypothetical protein
VCEGFYEISFGEFVLTQSAPYVLIYFNILFFEVSFDGDVAAVGVFGFEKGYGIFYGFTAVKTMQAVRPFTIGPSTHSIPRVRMFSYDAYVNMNILP